MTWNAARNAQKDDARATVWRKVRHFADPGHHRGLDWYIFRSFWEARKVQIRVQEAIRVDNGETVLLDNGLMNFNDC